MQKKIANALRIAHLATAITVGVTLSISEAAPMRLLWGGFIVLIALTLSYRHMYIIKKPRTYSDTPIDDQVRRDLGIKDQTEKREQQPMSIREQIEYALVKAVMTNQEISQALNVPITVINSIETDLGLTYDI